MPATDPQWAKTLEDLQALSDDQLVKQHDALTKAGSGVVVGVNYYLAELARRDIAARERRMERLTQAIVFLAVVNVAAVVLSLAT